MSTKREAARQEVAGSELPEEPAERVRAVLERILSALEVRAGVEVAEDEETIVATVDGSDLGLLIGKHGRTIDAVQLLCLQVAFRDRGDRKRVVVDAAGYRERRQAILQRKADRAAQEALRYGRPVELESMGAQERRVIHTYLADRAGIETHSEGDEPHRCVVVESLVSG